MRDVREPTERDRYWLDHEGKLSASGLTAKAYAAEHSLKHLFRRAIGIGEENEIHGAADPFALCLRPALNYGVPGGYLCQWAARRCPAKLPATNSII